MQRVLLALVLMTLSATVWAQGSDSETDGETDADSDSDSDSETDSASDAESTSTSLRPGRGFLPLRAAVEQTLVLALGAVWYWADKKHNAVDWDFDSWQERLTSDAFRYDNNAFSINFAFHPMSGSAMYGLPRANGMTLPASYAYGFLTSFTWEWILEFKERFSINDQIVTPTAGLAIGEFLIKTGRYLNSGPHMSLGRRLLAWTVGLPVAVHRAMDGAPAETRPVDRFGYAAEMWREFRISMGALHVQSGGDDAWFGEVRFEGEIVELPDFLEPGKRARGFGDANVTRMRMRATRGADGGAYEIFADTLLAGYAHEDIREERGAREGHALIVGTSVAYLYRRQSFGVWEDRLGILGLPGLALDLHLFRGGVKITLRGRVHADFAGVHSATFHIWEAANVAGLAAKSILRKQSYYYGWGFTTRLELAISARHVDLGGRFSRGWWRSHEGLDRAQDQVTADLRLQDRRIDAEAWLRVRPWRGGLFFELAMSGTWRRAQLEGIATENTRLTTTVLSVGVLR